jgi:hypothetical protein
LRSTHPSRPVIGRRGTNLRADLTVDDLRVRIKLIGVGDATEHESGYTITASIDATPVLSFKLDDTSACAIGS